MVRFDRLVKQSALCFDLIGYFINQLCFYTSTFFFNFSSVLFVLLVTPALLKPEQIPLPTCYFKQLTGHSCPTCGITHAFYETAHLRLGTAFQHHLMGPLLYFALFILLLKLVFEFFSGKRIAIRISVRLRKMQVYFTLFVWFGYWVVRFIGELQVG